MEFALDKQLDYNIKENQTAIKTYIQEHYQTIVVEEIKYQKKLCLETHKRFSIEKFCGLFVADGKELSKSTLYAWINKKGLVLRGRAFLFISQFHTFQKMYKNHLFLEMIYEGPKKKTLETIITLFSHSPDHAIWRMIIDTFCHVNDSILAGTTKKWEKNQSLLSELYTETKKELDTLSHLLDVVDYELTLREKEE